jgi:hypothetical protein
MEIIWLLIVVMGWVAEQYFLLNKQATKPKALDSCSLETWGCKAAVVLCRYGSTNAVFKLR